MGDPLALERLVRQVAAQVRRRRMEYYGVRGLFYGALLAVIPLVLKGSLGASAPWVALGVVAVSALVGIGFALAQASPRPDLARLADRACGLEDRVATALEWVGRPERPPLVEALIRDATERIAEAQSRAMIRRQVPREARLLPLPVTAVAALALMPAIPLPAIVAQISGATEEDARAVREGQAGSVSEVLAKTDPLKPPASLGDRDLVKTPSTGKTQMNDRPAMFKDTTMGGKRPDFDRFLKNGDDRLRLLDQANKLPDLQSDFTRSQYKMVAQEATALNAGRQSDRVSDEKLKDILEELQKMGQKSGSEAEQFAMQGLQALKQGQQQKALDRMNQALNVERQSDEDRKGALNLQGGRRGQSGRANTESGESRQFGSPEQDEPGAAKGKMPGIGPSPDPKGDPTARLNAPGVETSLEGDPKDGNRDNVDLNLYGSAASVPSRSAYAGAFEQYRKMMEDAIAREQVPRDYQTQVKEYFRALGEK